MKIGDKVAYSVQFLKSIGMSHSYLAAARGTVKNINKLSSNFTLVEVDWQDPDIPAKINIKNLAKVGANTKFCAC